MGEGGILNYIRILLVFIVGLSIFPSPHAAVSESDTTPLPISDINGTTQSPSSPIAATVTSTSVNNSQNEIDDGLIRANLTFVMKHLGMIECEDTEDEGEFKATNFLEQMFGQEVSFNKSNFLCSPTCRGTCVPRPRDVGIPPPIYPFGCSCETKGCDENGPIVAPLIKPTFTIACRQDPYCTCVGMGPGQFTGYSCNWVNERTKLPVTFKIETGSKPKPMSSSRPERAVPGPPLPYRVPPFQTRFYPIRWCSCCPRTKPIVKK